MAVTDSAAVTWPVEIHAGHDVFVRFAAAHTARVGALLDPVDVNGENLVAVVVDLVTCLAEHSDTLQEDDDNRAVTTHM